MNAPSGEAEIVKRLYPDIAGLAQSSSAMLEAFFREGLEKIDSPFYSHAVRWRNNRRTRRFFNDGLVNGESSHFDHLTSGLPADFNRWSPLARAQYLEISIFLSHYLLSSQGDRMGMAHSVEGRFPFLDVRLVEFCNNLDSRMKLRCLREKWLLKKAAQPWLPDAIHRRPAAAVRGARHVAGRDVAQGPAARAPHEPDRRLLRPGRQEDVRRLPDGRHRADRAGVVRPRVRS
jgi:asparagine synthase (glutamine-hydrolysing)